MAKSRLGEWEFVVINPRGIASAPMAASEALRLHAIHGYTIAALVCPVALEETAKEQAELVRSAGA